ncbi:hypothetical protein EGX79_03150 [Corynebacterium jeikeium]|nr:hypothetical protein EGX79_03150 [Corynebacterium jeikeium]
MAREQLTARVSPFIDFYRAPSRQAAPRHTFVVYLPLIFPFPLPPRYLVSVPDNGDSRWSRYGLPAL